MQTGMRTLAVLESKSTAENLAAPPKEPSSPTWTAPPSFHAVLREKRTLRKSAEAPCGCTTSSDRGGKWGGGGTEEEENEEGSECESE